jgi:hypothetical protein
MKKQVIAWIAERFFISSVSCACLCDLPRFLRARSLDFHLSINDPKTMFYQLITV